MVESGESVVKWLYPGAEDQNTVSDMDSSDLQTDKSQRGSEMDKSSPTDSGTDTASIQELPLDPTSQITELGQKASSFVGSFFQSSWYSGGTKEAASSSSKVSPGSSTEKEDKPETSSTSSFSTSFFNTIGKVSSSLVGSDSAEHKKEQHPEGEKEEEEEKVEATKGKESSGFGYLTSAFSKIGLSGLTSSSSSEPLEEGEKAQVEEAGEKEGDEVEGASFFSNAFSKVGKAASSYTKVLQDTMAETVGKAPLLGDFNLEQEKFIKSKGEKDVPSAPWSGYQNEEELREKILALSLDQRNFLRAPPSGVQFDMESAAVSTHALLLLKEDERLEKIRYQLVPKQIKEEEFWRNYFYRVGLLQQSFELNNMTIMQQTQDKKENIETKRSVEEEPENQVHPDHEDEFVSESHQVSSRDLQEADEAMKKLGLDKDEAEWEAELDGELEYEMVQGDLQTDNPEWEEQIQELLEAEKEK